MADPSYVDLFAGLRGSTKGARAYVSAETVRTRVGGEWRAREKAAIYIEAPPLFLLVDQKEIGWSAAAVLLALIQDAMLSGRLGRTPDPLTMERRRYRELQAANNGDIDERIRDRKLRSKGKRRWAERYRSARGITADPGSPPVRGVWGIESGLMLKAMVVLREADQFRIVTANNRSIYSATKSMQHMSAMMRVFNGINMTPVVQRALASITRVLTKKLVAKKTSSFKKQLREFERVSKQGLSAYHRALSGLSRLQSLGRAVAELGEGSKENE